MEKEQILAQLKLILTQEESEEMLNFVVQRSMEMVRRYCNLFVIPKELYGVCVSIAMALLEKQNSTIQSVREGLVAVTFRENKQVGNSEEELLRRFSTELNYWRKLQF